VKAEGFGHQVVGAAVKAADPRINLLPGGEDEHRQIHIECANLFEDLLAVLDRHTEVEDGEIGQVLAKGLNGGSAVMGKSNPMPVGFQTAA
jgi:hypothetical protein